MMVQKAVDVLARDYHEKTRKALELFLHSARKLRPFDPALLMVPDALEPYDALAGRFERGIEMVVNPLLKILERSESGIVSETVRDRLNFAAKIGLIDEVDVWMEMRAARNRMAHDYLPEQIKALYDLLLTRYRYEIERFLPRMESYIARRRAAP